MTLIESVPATTSDRKRCNSRARVRTRYDFGQKKEKSLCQSPNLPRLRTEKGKIPVPESEPATTSTEKGKIPVPESEPATTSDSKRRNPVPESEPATTSDSKRRNPRARVQTTPVFGQ